MPPRLAMPPKVVTPPRNVMPLPDRIVSPRRAVAPLCRVAVFLAALPLAAQAQQIVPDAIAVPGSSAVLTVHAVGAQVYECVADADRKLAWRFREPIATLMA